MPLLLSPPHARPFTFISRATLRPTARGHALDFNLPPDDAAYALLVGDPLLPAQKQKLAASRVVHASIDPSAAMSLRFYIYDSLACGRESGERTKARAFTPTLCLCRLGSKVNGCRFRAALHDVNVSLPDLNSFLVLSLRLVHKYSQYETCI